MTTDHLAEQEQEVARGRAAHTPFALLAAVAVAIATLFGVALAFVWLAGWLG